MKLAAETSEHNDLLGKKGDIDGDAFETKQIAGIHLGYRHRGRRVSGSIYCPRGRIAGAATRGDYPDGEQDARRTLPECPERKGRGEVRSGVRSVQQFRNEDFGVGNG